MFSPVCAAPSLMALASMAEVPAPAHRTRTFRPSTSFLADASAAASGCSAAACFRRQRRSTRRQRRSARQRAQRCWRRWWQHHRTRTQLGGALGLLVAEQLIVCLQERQVDDGVQQDDDRDKYQGNKLEVRGDENADGGGVAQGTTKEKPFMPTLSIKRTALTPR